MDKVLSALQKIERFDVISEIKDYVHNLVSAASQAATDGYVNSDGYSFLA